MVAVDPALVVFALIALAGVLFVSELLPNEIAALSVLVLLVILEPWTGVGYRDALLGFANPATVTVLAMFILSHGVQRTGVLEEVGRRLARYAGESEWRQSVATLGLAGPIAGFVNNTPVVSVLIPVIADVANRGGRSPSKLLLPLSYVSMMGGMLTLLGTSANVVASDFSRRLLGRPFGMFEFTPLGVIVLLVGAAYLLTLGRWLTPARVEARQDLVQRYGVDDYTARVLVRRDSPLVGWTPDDGFEVEVLEIVRGGDKYLVPFTDQAVEERDILTVMGSRSEVRQFVDRRGLRLLPRADVTDDELCDADHTLVELAVPPDSEVAGKSVEDLNFRERYQANVLGVRRGSKVVRLETDLEFEAGDSVLVQCTRGTADLLEENRDFVVSRRAPTDVRDVVIGEEALERRGRRRRKAPLAFGILAAVVVVAALGWLHVSIAALAGVVAMVVTGCVRTTEAYESVDWSIIFLLAGLIPLGLAMQNTGGADLIASALVGAGGVLPDALLLALFYVSTSLLANLIGSNAGVVLMIPVAVEASARLGLNAFAFVLAVTFAASTAFMTPVGYQTNLLVYGPGGYRFTDYFRVGAPLQLLLAVVTTLGIVFIWGL